MVQLSVRQTTNMCHRVGTALNAGMDLLAVLRREAEHGSPSYRSHMSQVAEQVRNGKTLAEALGDCNEYFRPLVCELVGVGEETGRLESVLLRLADHYQHVSKIRQVFLLGILWPALQFGAAILIIGGLIFLLGFLGTSASVLGLSGARGAIIYFAFVALALGCLAGVIIGLLQGWFGPQPGRMLMHVPGIGKALQTMALARISWTLSMALNAGVDAKRAMQLALQSSQSEYFTRHLDQVQASIGRGDQFYEALDQTGAFPEEFIQHLGNAEISGTESESLTRMSREYQRQAEASATALAVILSMVIWGMVAALLVAVIVYLFTTLYLAPYREAFEMLENP